MTAQRKATARVQSQSRTTEWRTSKDGKERCRAFIRYDDQCNNGHNTFSITGETQDFDGGRWREGSGGCIHETVAAYFPEYEKYIKWHLVSSDGPLHYIANTVYHAEKGDFEAARSTAVWPDATDTELSLPKAKLTALLNARLSQLLEDFQNAIEELGFILGRKL